MSSGARATSGSVLVLSNYFPPEVNALATRTWEHARVWTAEGATVGVLAGPPHFPEGRVYDGYRNRLSRTRIDGVDVLRVPMYVAANEGFLRRSLSYVSYMVSAALFARRTRVEPDVVVASSPQFFAGLGGWLVSRRLRRPFVLEIRDLWPESILQVGAMRRSVAIRILEALEGFLYRAADHVVIVSPGFRSHIEARGVPKDRITTLPNGIDTDWLDCPPPEDEVAALRSELDLEGKFVVSYLGTVGMAHGIEVMLESAGRCEDPDVVFLVAGAGAEWEHLRDAADRAATPSFRLLAKETRERIRRLHALTDVAVVHLRDRPAFRKVIPSKMFESMAMRRPIVLGVQGEARKILDAAGAGLAITPEDPAALLDAVLRLKADPDLRRSMGESGAAHVRRHYDREVIAKRYLELLRGVAASR